MSNEIASGSAWGGVPPAAQEQPRQRPTDARSPLDRRALEDAMILSGTRGSDGQRAVRVGELEQYLGGLSQQFQVPINNLSGLIADPALLFRNAGLSAPEIVDVLPNFGNFPGRLVFLTTDNKLYRWTGTEWTASVPAVDITGQISAAQIAEEVTAAISAAQADASAADEKANTIRADHDALVQGFTGTLNAAFTDVNATISDLEGAIQVDIASLTSAVDDVVATVTSETTARITADTAEANARQSLATQLRGTYSGTDIANVQGGLIHSERQARITADSNLQSQINTLVAASSGDFGDLFAAIEEESTARITADAALSGNFSDLTARLDNVRDANGNLTNKTVEATLSDDRVARANADSALAADIVGLEATIGSVSANLSTNYYTGVQTNSAISAAQTALRSEIQGTRSALLPSNFQIGFANWTEARTGDPATVGAVTVRCQFVSNDADFGACVEFTTSAAGQNIMTRGVIPGGGRVYRVRARFKVLSAPAATHRYSFMIQGMNASFGSTFAAFPGATSYPVGSGIHEASLTFAESTGFGVDTIVPGMATSAYIRVGFRADLSGNAIARIASIIVEDVTDVVGVSANLEANYYTEAQTDSAIAAASQTLQANINNVSSTVATQGTAIATLEGNASAGYLIRAQAGNQVSLLDLVAADGVGGAVSVAKISATNIILDGSVTAASLGVGSVTADKIATNAVTAVKIDAGAVTADKIAANAITADKLAANSVTANSIAANTITGGLLATSGIITQVAQIGDGLITNAKIADAAITRAKIGSAAIGTAQIENGAITNTLIANAAITNAKIGDLQVNNAKIANLTVGGEKIQNGAITSAGAAYGSVGSLTRYAWTTVTSLSLGTLGGRTISFTASGDCLGNNIRILVNGTVVRQLSISIRTTVSGGEAAFVRYFPGSYSTTVAATSSGGSTLLQIQAYKSDQEYTGSADGYITAVEFKK